MTRFVDTIRFSTRFGRHENLPDQLSPDPLVRERDQPIHHAAELVDVPLPAVLRELRESVGADLAAPRDEAGHPVRDRFLLLLQGCLLYTSPSPRD